MVSLRLSSLVILLLTAMTFVSCSNHDPPHIHNFAVDHGHQIALADYSNSVATLMEDQIRLPRNHLRPAIAITAGPLYNSIQEFVNHDRARFMEIQRWPNVGTYAAPVLLRTEGRDTRAVLFMNVHEGGTVTPLIRSEVKEGVLPGRREDLWTLLLRDARFTNQDLAVGWGGALHL